MGIICPLFILRSVLLSLTLSINNAGKHESICAKHMVAIYVPEWVYLYLTSSATNF